MNEHVSDRIELSALIKAPRNRVWAALTTPADFAAWFGCRFTGEFTEGARVVMTSTHAGYEDMPFVVEIERVKAESLFSWRWHPGVVRPDVDYANEPETLVEFRLEDEEGGTRLTVTEKGFDAIPESRRASVHKDNVGGWKHQMVSLERFVTAG